MLLLFYLFYYTFRLYLLFSHDPITVLPQLAIYMYLHTVHTKCRFVKFIPPAFALCSQAEGMYTLIYIFLHILYLFYIRIYLGIIYELFLFVHKLKE